MIGKYYFYLYFSDNYFRARNASKAVHTTSRRDIIGAARGVLRLQKLYNLDVRSMCNGFPANETPVTHMNARDRYDVGRVAYLAKDDRLTEMWMKEALRENAREEDNKALKLSALDHIAYLQYKVRVRGHMLLGKYRVPCRLTFV